MRPFRLHRQPIRVTGLTSLLLAAGAVPATLAQEFTGPVLSATISQRFEVDSNYRLDSDSPGTSYFGDTRLALGYNSVTTTQSFSLGLNTGLRALREADDDENGDDFEFEVASPTTASLGYSQEWADAALSTSARYRQSRVDFDQLEIEFDDFGVPDSINQISGNTTERRYDGSVQLQLATDAPSSYSFSLSATHVDYSENSDDRVARTTVSGGATWSLALTPVMSSIVSASYMRYEADDDEDTELNVAELDVGLNYAMTQYLSVGAGFGYADRRRDETIGGERVRTEDEQGPTLWGTVNYAFEDISLSGNLRISDAAPDTQISGSLQATYPLPRGSLNGRVFQSYSGGSSSGDEVRLTGASLGLTRDLTSISRVGFGVQMALQENQDDPSDPDVHRLDATATYSRDFSEVLSADIGYRFRYRDEDDTARSHSVFFSIGRSFATGF